MNTICIVGPTGVGKTEATEKIARAVNGEIINMDLGQLYKEISIGTAKPVDWEYNPIKHHLFSILEKPIDFSVVAYRNKVANSLTDIHARGKNAIIVGGSLFYLQSLLFRLPDQSPSDMHKNNLDFNSTTFTWEFLNAIDPERAMAIHPQDKYRIQRALHIWYTTGKKPSAQKPFWCPIINNISLLWLAREKNDLEYRISNRLEQMIAQGWLAEVMGLDEEWKQYVHRKKLCGYNIVVDACRKQKQELDTYDKELIKKDTLSYVKKQKTFWAYLKNKHLTRHINNMSITELNLTFQPIDLYLEKIVLSKGNL